MCKAQCFVKHIKLSPANLKGCSEIFYKAVILPGVPIFSVFERGRCAHMHVSGPD